MRELTVTEVMTSFTTVMGHLDPDRTTRFNGALELCFDTKVQQTVVDKVNAILRKESEA